jgi:hypothetical protein
MSKYEYEYQDDGYKCPYCGQQTTCDDWGFDYEGEIQECEECNKKYYATAIHNIDFKSMPDCELNNDRHILNKRLDCYFCDICGKCILNNEEK